MWRNMIGIDRKNPCFCSVRGGIVLFENMATGHSCVYFKVTSHRCEYVIYISPFIIDIELNLALVANLSIYLCRGIYFPAGSVGWS